MNGGEGRTTVVSQSKRWYSFQLPAQSPPALRIVNQWYLKKEVSLT